MQKFTMASGINRIYVNSDVYMCCLSHAMSTDKEEVMGILIGQFQGNSCLVEACCPLLRLDKRKDRVEIGPEHMSEAMNDCEKYAKEEDTSVSIVGWYHSHPHITIFPSAVDVRTQYQYQMMEPRFLGLIYGVYNTDAQQQMNRLELICFQSTSEARYSQIPVLVIPRNIQHSLETSSFAFQQLERLPLILHDEEKMAYEKFSAAEGGFDIEHNESILTKNFCKQWERLVVPLQETIKSHLFDRKFGATHAKPAAASFDAMINSNALASNLSDDEMEDGNLNE